MTSACHPEISDRSAVSSGVIFRPCQIPCTSETASPRVSIIPFHPPALDLYSSNETFEKWLHRVSKSFSLMGTDFKSVPKRKIFDSPLANHFSAVMQISLADGSEVY
jgi:hypothetical protein